MTDSICCLLQACNSNNLHLEHQRRIFRDSYLIEKWLREHDLKAALDILETFLKSE